MSWDATARKGLGSRFEKKSAHLEQKPYLFAVEETQISKKPSEPLRTNWQENVVPLGSCIGKEHAYKI